MTDSNEDLVQRVVNGDVEALEKLVINVKDSIYNLSLRMLWNPADAEDVTQEILIKVISNLSQFRNESKLSTWVYRIASNYLITTRKRGLEHQELSFEMLENGIKEGYIPKSPVDVFDADRNILTEELKVSCTHAMLLCLSREERIVYILSAIFNVKSSEGAMILDIRPDAYRKRLSRAKEKMRGFMEKNCGLVNHQTCECNKRIEVAIENRRINPKQLIFVNKMVTRDKVMQSIDEMEGFDQASAVFQSNPYYLAPETILNRIKNIVFAREYSIIEN